MKILFLTPWYPDEKLPNHGIFIQDQATALAANNQVQVISSKVDYTGFGFFSKKIIVNRNGNLTEKKLTIKRSLPLFNQINYFYCTISESLKTCKEFNPDVIHSNIGYPGAFWGWCVSLLTKKPWILSEHTLLNNNFRSPVHRWFTIHFLQKANAVVTVSNYSAGIIKKNTGIKAIVIPNIIRFDLFKEKKLSTKPEVHIGFLGSGFFEKKGLMTLLTALSKINANYILHIGGNDPKRNFYEMHAKSLGIENKCLWHGEILRNQVPEFMDRLDFFVNCSLFESFGMAIAEAMSCGLPVVCTSNGGPADFINETNGILVPAGDDASLSQALLKMINHYGDYDSKIIREQVKVKFSESPFCNSINAVYLNAIKHQV